MNEKRKTLTIRQDFIESCARWLASFHEREREYTARLYIRMSTEHNSNGNLNRQAYLHHLDNGGIAQTRFYNAIARRTAELVERKP